jgi:hypothetical protein
MMTAASDQASEQRPPKPRTYNGDLRKLPRCLAYLAGERIWLLWRWKWTGTNWTKPPHRADNPDCLASTSDPTTWSDYQTALRQVLAGRADGFGFAVRGQNIGGNDLDHCRDPETEAIAPWAKEYIEQFPGAYTEVTVSGTGLRILGTSEIYLASKFPLPEKGNGARIELFSNSTHYLTLSCNELGSCRVLPPIGARMQEMATKLSKRGNQGATQDDSDKEQNEQHQRQHQQETIAWCFTTELRLRSALSAIPADEKVLTEKLGNSHEVWIRIGMAIERLGWGERGYAIFRDWSMQSTKEFNEKGLRTQWSSFNRNRDSRENPVTVGTIFHYAKQFGWNEPQSTTTTDQSTLPEPVDLWAQFDPPELPRDILPKIIEDFARERSDIMGADPAGLALAALAVCAAAIPDRITLQVKKRDPAWKESARLWVALIAPPSGKKSPIMSEAARPLKRLDAEMFAVYLSEKAKYDELSKEEKKTATAPRQVRLRIEDTTIEAVQEVFKDSHDGVLCLQDELSGWFGAMDKYTSGRGAAKDRAFWLQAYNGGSYAVNRIGRGAALIHNNGISVLGGIQPALLRQIVEGSVDDGLIQRLLPIVLQRGYESKDQDPEGAVGLYACLIERLGSRTSSTPVLVHFEDGGYAIRQRLEGKHLDLMSCETINPKLAAHIGKYDGIFARLCLIWHCIEHAEEDLILPVSENTALHVEQFLHGFLFPHALAFYSGLLGLADDHNRLTAVAGYILARELTTVTNRDVARGDRTMRGLTKAETSAVFEQLEALGWVNRTPGPRPTDPPHWKVNPKCHQKFTARAKREAEQRQKDRDLIAAVFQQEGAI